MIRRDVNARLRETEGWAELTTLQRVSALGFIASEYAFLVAMSLGVLAAVADWRVGAYLIIVGLTFHLLGRQLTLLAFGASIDDLETSPTEKRMSLAGLGFMLVLVAGLLAALLDWQLGAYLAVGALVGLLASHVAVGVHAYRRVMRRPWPQVPPIVEDDDW